MANPRSIGVNMRRVGMTFLVAIIRRLGGATLLRMGSGTLLPRGRRFLGRRTMRGERILRYAAPLAREPGHRR